MDVLIERFALGPIPSGLGRQFRSRFDTVANSSLFGISAE